MSKSHFVIYLICAAMLLLAACGGEEPTPEPPLRTPHATFTPTPLGPTPTPAPAEPNTASASADAAPPAAQPAEVAIAVINDELVNIRNAPSLTASEVVQMAVRGTEFTVVGRSADDEWWQLCCVDGAQVWVYESYVDTTGPVDALPVVDQAAAAPTATPEPPPPAPEQPTAPPTAPPTAAAPTDTPQPTDTPPPALPFNLAGQEQFPEENNLVRIFVYATASEKPAPGLTLRVARDGAELPVTGVTAAEAGMTWPVQNPRQRFQNLKVEFPNVQFTGTWTVQLVDGSGAPAGPAATFTLAAGDTNREFYVRYDKP
jgi:hypothetical protein